MSKPSNFDIPESLECVWNALHTVERDNEYHPNYVTDERWDDICTAMAWITEALGYDISTSEYRNGEYMSEREKELAMQVELLYTRVNKLQHLLDTRKSK